MKGSADRVLIIGGGVIGASIRPHYLNRAGLRVTIVDRATMGAGCSHANCGYISPSHILPLATPTALALHFDPCSRRIRHSGLSRDSILRYGCGSFVSRAAAISATCSNRVTALMRFAPSRALYDELIKEGIQCEFEAKGMIFVHRLPARMEHFAEMDHMLKEEFGLAAQRIDGEALNRMEPALVPGLAGGWYYPNDAHLKPDSLMTSWQHALEASGVEVREKCTITHIRREGRKAIAAVTAEGEIQSDFIVFATGAWTPLLNRSPGIAGCRSNLARVTRSRWLVLPSALFIP